MPKEYYAEDSVVSPTLTIQVVFFQLLSLETRIVGFFFFPIKQTCIPLYYFCGLK